MTGSSGDDEDDSAVSLRASRLDYAMTPSMSALSLSDMAGPDVAEDGDAATGDATPSSRAGKLHIVACKGAELETIQLHHGSIFLPPFAKKAVKFVWDAPPRRALVVIKPGEASTEEALLHVADNLEREHGVEVVVEASIHARVSALRDKESGRSLAVFRPGVDGGSIDFVVTLGGDGTILWTSSLFPKGVPPVLSFSMGTLGFLTSFSYFEHERWVARMVQGGLLLSLRTRLRCKLYTCSPPADDADASPAWSSGRLPSIARSLVPSFPGAVGDDAPAPASLPSSEGAAASSLPQALVCEYERCVGSFVVLNELAVNRGPQSNLIDLDLFCDGVPVTKVQADGLLVSTPTGSTAYSLSAGGSIVHPGVSTMLLTPICPHSLSFRPLLFPDAVTLQLQVPHTSKGTAMVAFDGKSKHEMVPGDYVTIQMSPYPLPSVVNKTDTEDWFQSLTEGMHWNQPNEELRKPSLNAYGRSLNRRNST